MTANRCKDCGHDSGVHGITHCALCPCRAFVPDDGDGKCPTCGGNSGVAPAPDGTVYCFECCPKPEDRPATASPAPMPTYNKDLCPDCGLGSHECKMRPDLHRTITALRVERDEARNPDFCPRVQCQGSARRLRAERDDWKAAFARADRQRTHCHVHGCSYYNDMMGLPACEKCDNDAAERDELRAALENTLGWMERNKVGHAHAQAIRAALTKGSNDE